MFYINGFHWRFNTASETPFYRARSVIECFLQSLHLPGDVAELGLYQGQTFLELYRYMLTNNIDKALTGVDWFKGLYPTGDDIASDAKELSVKTRGRDLVDGISCVGDKDRLLNNLRSLEETFPGSPTIAQLVIGDIRNMEFPPERQFCFVYSDLDLYEPTKCSIEIAKKHLVPGGCLVVDDYGADRWWPGVRKAVDETDWTDWAVERDGRENIWQFKAWRMR